jgi:hypothetical protein
LLSVPTGLISETKSELKIITSEGKLIYSNTLVTDYLARYKFEPDTIPQYGGQEVFDEYILTYVNSITKEQFEEYTNNSIKSFFDGIFVDKAKMKDIIQRGEITDRNSFDEIFSDIDSKIIFFPDFASDEGGYYIGYSKSKVKAVALLATD